MSLHFKNSQLVSLIIVLFGSFLQVKCLDDKYSCYSCASDSMKSNFLTRSRGPQKRIKEPRIYDNMCDLDSWLIKEKSKVSCYGPCFKWQQILNNSGLHSYSTIRGCYMDMINNSKIMNQSDMKSQSECNNSEQTLTCIDQSTLIEHFCLCQGDFCNSAQRHHLISLIPVIAAIFYSLGFPHAAL